MSTKSQSIILLALGLIWGSGYNIARYAMTHGVPPSGYTFWQLLGLAIILSTLCWRHLRFDRIHLIFYGGCGLIGLAIPNTIMYYSSAHLSAGLLAVVINTVPIMIYPLALLSQQETFNGFRFIGVLLASVGLMLLIIPHASLPNIAAVKWILIALIAPFCFAIFSIFINPWRPQSTDALSLAAGMLLAATLLLLPWVILTHQFYPLHSSLPLTDKIIILETLLSSIGYALLFKLLATAGAVYYSLVDVLSL